jgi:hypothetical protein
MARPSRSDASVCQWISGREALKRFATHAGGVQSASHIKPLHWYIACRLVLEGGFHPDQITPRPPFEVTQVGRGRGLRHRLSYDPAKGGTGEQVILGGLKTKNVDVVVTNPRLGPVLAVSCKGTTGAFRNLTNRMEETIGECTNLHITYPAMVIGYYSLLRGNRTVQDALEAPEIEDSANLSEPRQPIATALPVVDGTSVPASVAVQIRMNDIAIQETGLPTDGIVRFHQALSEMTLRHGIRDEISRYEAMTVAIVEPRGEDAGKVLEGFPPTDSPLHPSRFFHTLYQRYYERFVYGAPLLDERGITTLLEWDPESPVLDERHRSLIDCQPRVYGRAQALSQSHTISLT